MNLQPPPSSLWLEDEIIGWIYQFYNAEQKEAIRARGAPKRPAEVAVINQFFTPRWIVKFLVDNTLGRLWLEMHLDSPRVRAKCDYLVPEPTNQQISESANDESPEKAHGVRNTQYVLDPDSPVNNPMANVAEVGSLLRVEERLRAILAKAGHWAGEETARLDPRTQRPLPGMGGKGGQFALADLPEAQPDDWGAHYTVARLLDDLREFAAGALQTHDLNAQLFAEEAEKSVHLLDVFLNDYEVAVMNPPYGDSAPGGRDYIRRSYPRTYYDVYAAFLERARDLVGV